MFVDWMVYLRTTYRGEDKVSGDVEMERGGEREGKQERDGEGRTPAPAFFQLATLSISTSLEVDE